MDRMHDWMSAQFLIIIYSICNFTCTLCCSVSSGSVLSHSVVLLAPIDVAAQETHMAAMVNFPGLRVDVVLLCGAALFRLMQ